MERTANRNHGIGAMGRISRMALLGAIAFGLTSLAATGTAFGKQEQMRFTNNSGVMATDLHIEFNRGSLKITNVDPADSLPLNDSDETKSTINLKSGLSGKGVGNGNSITITFQYSGSDPKVKSAWWTNGNTFTPVGRHDKGKDGTGDYIPKGELQASDMTLSWVGNREATGDGQYLVMIDGQPRPFDTFPGDTPGSVSARFSQFVQEWEFGLVLAEDFGLVQCTGYSYFTDLPNIQIDVLQQDSTLELMVDQCDMQLEVFNLVAGERAEFTITDSHDGQVVAIVYSLKPGYTGVNGVAGYCGSLGLKGVTPNNLIGQGPIVGGQYTKFLPIPPNVAGLELVLQGILRDTCPGSCESNVVTQVIQK